MKYKILGEMNQGKTSRNINRDKYNKKTYMTTKDVNNLSYKAAGICL